MSLQLQPVANWAIIHFYQIFSNSLSLLLNSLFLTVLTLILLANPKQYRNLLIQGFPSFYRKRADSIISKCEVGLVNYLGGIVLSMAFIGIASTIGLLVLQVCHS
ncbi:MAG: AI-2E family transporter [Cyanobacteria bacterium CAN_BIN43]|nr:AI-2E family transporter [Cyanobacteria bacterium CAN_BIN43]